MLFVSTFDPRDKKARGEKRKMSVLFCVPLKGEIEVRLQQEVEDLVPRKKRVVCRTIDRLFRKLQQVPKDLSVAVLLAANLEDRCSFFKD